MLANIRPAKNWFKERKNNDLNFMGQCGDHVTGKRWETSWTSVGGHRTGTGMTLQPYIASAAKHTFCLFQPYSHTLLLSWFLDLFKSQLNEQIGSVSGRFFCAIEWPLIINQKKQRKKNKKSGERLNCTCQTGEIEFTTKESFNLTVQFIFVCAAEENKRKRAPNPGQQSRCQLPQSDRNHFPCLQSHTCCDPPPT